tara:strand:- start:117 stop:239 length:123 start_codon:yes stop_codon:yes gene_type:complete
MIEHNLIVAALRAKLTMLIAVGTIEEVAIPSRRQTQDQKN